MLDAVRHHRDLPHQLEAWQLLERSLTAEQLSTFAVAFRATAGAQAATRPLASPARDGLIQLPVPYLSQNDSSTGKPDDRYLALVQRYGDTTEASAQVAALQSLEIKARFRTDGAIENLIQQLQRGMPCPVSWLHKGPASAPHGGGHWSLVIGWDPATRQLLMHDPNGEADLVNGGYVSTAIGSGQALRYSERNWGRRWQVEGPGSGWWIQLTPTA